MTESLPTLNVRIWRGAADGRFETFAVPRRDHQTVLDVVTYVQRELDPTLAYRFACRVGMCGSCGMTVNGRPRWTCRTHVEAVTDAKGELEIAPLRSLPVIRDLATDMTPFFDKWQKAQGRATGAKTRHEEPERIDPASPRRQAADAAIECINCGVCYAACDVVASDPDYLGPAALNRAWSLVNDDREADRAGVLQAATAGGGCHSCHSHGSCVEHCPVGLNPSRGIAGLKRLSLLAMVGGKV
jgi:fumarate reductase iron-sulfur subunit